MRFWRPNCISLDDSTWDGDSSEIEKIWKEEQERNMRNATLNEDIRYFNQIESRRDAIYALLWLTEKKFSISDIIEACDYPYLAINNQILSTTERQNVKSLGIETQNKSNIVQEHYVEFTTGRTQYTDIEEEIIISKSIILFGKTLIWDERAVLMQLTRRLPTYYPETDEDNLEIPQFTPGQPYYHVCKH